MKKLRLLSLVGITSFALAHAGLAAGHGGGGGGHGGGGFHGGSAGGGFHGGGFRGGQFSLMRGGHMFGRGGFHGGGFRGDRFGGGFRGGRFGDRHHRFNNNVIFFDDFGFPGWWAGAIRMDITVPTITRTIGTAGTVTKGDPGYGYRSGSRSKAFSEFAEAVTSARDGV